jgi:hypothetical protein
MVSSDDALGALAAELREEGSVISPHVQAPGDQEPALGLLAAAGPRARRAPGEYALLIESIREGYLLHYGEPRVVVGADDDLALLAGDYLYALGLERLAALADLEAIRELSDLISISAQLHAGGEEEVAAEDAPPEGADALWLASVVAIAAGPGPNHEGAKAGLRREQPDAPAALWQSARQAAEQAGLGEALAHAAEAIRFTPR